MDGTATVTEVRRGRRRQAWWLVVAATCAFAPAATAWASPAVAPRPQAACTGATYTVVPGDGWYLIASKTGVPVKDLLAANGATLTTPLFPNQKLCLPPAGSTVPSTAPVTTVASGTVQIAQFPVQGKCYFTDTFGAPRSGGRSHEGVDIIAKSGQYVYAAVDGTLTKQYIDAPGTLAGNGWRLTRSDGTYFFYAHLSAFAPGLKVGSAVKAGQIIGQVGMTGNAGTPHLHFEAHPGGGPAVNPTPIVKAVDGCNVTSVPPEPGDTPATTTPATTAPATTVPATTTPATTTPATTVPATTVPSVGSAPGGASAGLWEFVAPTLAFDTRGAQFVPGRAVRVTIGGVGGVPAAAPGAMVRLMPRNAAGVGYLMLHDCATGPDGTSVLNVQPGRLNVTMSLAALHDGSFCLTSSVAMDLRVYVVGYETDTGAGVQPMVTRRALDTRLSSKMSAGESRSMSPSRLGTPLGSKAVTATITLLAPEADGAFAIGPCGGTPWIVNYTKGISQVFSAIVRTNDAGVCITTTQAVHVVVDVTASWRTSAGGLGVVGATRVLDSRPGGVMPSGTTVSAGTPVGATSGQYTVTMLAMGTPSSLFFWNCADGKPAAAVAHAPAWSRTTATVTVDVRGGQLCLATTAPAQVVVDLVAAG